MKTLQKKSEIPLKKQLAAILKEEIKDFEINSRFYTDKKLIEKFNLSQPVIRAALSELVEEGYIKRIISKGTFVISHTPKTKRNSNFNIGVFCPLGNYPQMAAAKAIQEELENSHTVMFKNNYLQDIEEIKLPDDLDGMVWLASRSKIYSKIPADLKKNARKIVFANCLFMDNEISCVIRDDYSAVFQLVSDLIGKGFSKFGYLGKHDEFLFSQKRYEGFLSALKANNLEVKDEWIVTSENTEYKDGVECAKKIISSGSPLPECIICVTDPVAMSAIVTLKENGIRVPKDIIVTGFDDSDMAKQFSPAITTVNHNYESIGKFAAKSLIDQLNGNISSGFKYYSPCEIIFRESTCRKNIT